MITPPFFPPFSSRSLGRNNCATLGRAFPNFEIDLQRAIVLDVADDSKTNLPDSPRTAPFFNDVSEVVGPFCQKKPKWYLNSDKDSDVHSEVPGLVSHGSGGDSDSDMPGLVARRDIVVFGHNEHSEYPRFVSPRSDSDSDSDVPDLVPRRIISEDNETDTKSELRETHCLLDDVDLNGLINVESLIGSYRERSDLDAVREMFGILNVANAKQSAQSKNDKKPAATASGDTPQKKSNTPSKFDAIRKKLEEKGKKKLESNDATPQVSIDSTSTSDQDRADKVFTMGTECNCIIAWVGKFKNSNTPAFTRPFWQRLKDDDPLRVNCKIHLLALRRSQANGATFWSTSQWNREQTREYTLNWQLYIRYLEPSEPNTAEFRKAWGVSLTEILNRFGSGYPIPQRNKYEGDLGKGVLGDYCTYPVTFRRIEETYFPLRFSNQDIADDTDLLSLYFGENEEDIEHARDWYRTRCGLNVQAIQAHAAEAEDLSDIARNIF
jgi:hypothetical protein